jgi:hypothetical protein
VRLCNNSLGAAAESAGSSANRSYSRDWFAGAERVKPVFVRGDVRNGCMKIAELLILYRKNARIFMSTFVLLALGLKSLE